LSSCSGKQTLRILIQARPDVRPALPVRFGLPADELAEPRTPPEVSRPTILHVTSPFDGGVAQCVVDLVTDQIGRDWDVVVACPPNATFVSLLEAKGARHVPWPARRSPGPSVIPETVRLHRIVKDVRPDVVHLHSSKAGLCGRLAVRRARPTVFQPHNWSFVAYDDARSRAAARWERVAERWTTITLCVSQREQSEGRLKGLAGPMHVVPNGVDVQLPAASHAERERARRRLALPSAPTVVCVGRLTRAKGQDILLDAWPRIVARVPSAQLVLVGDGEDREMLARRASEEIRLVGHRDDVRNWIVAADVVAAPSRWEGMSLTLLDAMAAGRPVVATDVGGAREVLIPAAGAVVPPEDAEAFASAIIERLVDPSAAAAEGRIARERIERGYDVLRRTAEVAALYGVLIAGHDFQDLGGGAVDGAGSG
jgi:glycosyltransferase involved in cell wall biosynthesis